MVLEVLSSGLLSSSDTYKMLRFIGYILMFAFVVHLYCRLCDQERNGMNPNDGPSLQRSLGIVFDGVTESSTTRHQDDCSRPHANSRTRIDDAGQNAVTTSVEPKKSSDQCSEAQIEPRRTESFFATKGVVAACGARSTDTPNDAIMSTMTAPGSARNVIAYHQPSSGVPGTATYIRMHPLRDDTDRSDSDDNGNVDSEDNDLSDTEESVLCITAAHIVVESADAEERARIIREAKLAFVAETAQAEIIEEATGPATTARFSRSKYAWIALPCLILVGIVMGTSVVIGRRRRHPPNKLASNDTRPTTAKGTESPTASPTAWTADGKRAFSSNSELCAAVDGYLAWKASGGNANTSDDVLRYGLPIGSWDVSRVVDFSRVFDPDRQQFLERNRNPSKRSSFDDDLSGWNVSNANTMKGMFAGASTFTGKGLEMWDVSTVSDFSFMFADASAFVGDVSAWNTSSATRMDAMFFKAGDFNGGLKQWDVSNVKYMDVMFESAVYFVGGDMTHWNVGKVTSMKSMFRTAPKFTGKVSTWNTSQVVNMESMVRLIAGPYCSRLASLGYLGAFPELLMVFLASLKAQSYSMIICPPAR
jgi:surface protein